MANSSLDVSSLDFDTLKSKFITFLKSDQTFKDYNFEGSNMNVLLDVMSYNTYINSFYLNMVASEMFLDSAQKIDSVVSHAKELNYLPRSTRSPVAVIDFNIQTQGIDNPFIIPKNTIFSGYNSNGTFNFVTDQTTSYLSMTRANTADPASLIFTIKDMPIYEGFYADDVFIVDYTQETQKFILSNEKIDTNSLTITVSEDGGSTNTTYKYVDTLYNLTSNSTVYFLQASANQTYEVIFGDNVFGHKPINGAIVYANYIVSSGSDGNGVKNFELSQDLGPYNGGYVYLPNITTVSSSVGGSNTESIESIKFNAPRHFQTQGRCITSQDYKVTALQNFPELEDLSVYSGGINNTAVEFGRVYISPSAFSGVPLTESRRVDVETYLSKLSPIGIDVKVVDPEYLYVTINSTVYVDFASTKSSPSLLKTFIIGQIKQYNKDNLQRFNVPFRLSKLEQYINDSDIGILSNETYTQIYREYTPPLNTSYSLVSIFQNNIVPGTIYSSKFTYLNKNYIFTDNINGYVSGDGKLYQYEQNETLVTPNYFPVGTIDYTEGIVRINQTKFDSIFGALKIYATPVKKDIYCKDNLIVEIDSISGISTNIVSE